MDILEELKQQKESEQNEAEDRDESAGELNTYQHSLLAGAIKKIHDYLYELTNSLNQLAHTSTVDMQIPGFGAISNLHQNQYELLWENRANQNRVVLNFCTHIKDSCPIKLDGEKNDKVEDILSRAGIDFSSDQGNILLNGSINSSIVFSVNPAEQDITLTLNNFKQLGRQRYSLNAKHVNKAFFDQLARFLLHRENNFIELISAPAIEAIEHGSGDDLDDGDSGVHTQEMDISRVRSLFSREVQLYLTYHNTIKEINSRSGEFILGRSRQCNITVKSDLASRQHAKIVYRKGKYVLIDQSTNGTFVKSQGGKEVYVQGEQLPLSGSGFISLGKSVTVDNEHIIYFSCQ